MVPDEAVIWTEKVPVMEEVTFKVEVPDPPADNVMLAVLKIAELGVVAREITPLKPLRLVSVSVVAL